MRLFHVSEDADITVFHPRLPTRTDLDPAVGLVWAIDEARLPNFLTPRDCPRVTYHVGANTAEADRKRFFKGDRTHAVVLENDWLEIMRHTTLYLYEFEPSGFTLQDSIAGYYTAAATQIPIARHIVTDPLTELQKRNVEVRFIENLWETADRVTASTLHWSLCRMKNAKPRES